MTDAAREALRTVLNPKSVAIVGASENPNKWSGGARTRYRRSRPLAGSAPRPPGHGVLRKFPEMRIWQ